VELRRLEEEIRKTEGKVVYLGLQFMECAANQLGYFFMPRIQSDSSVREQLNATFAPIFVLLQVLDHYYFWPRICQAFFSLLPFTCVYKMNNAVKNFDNFIITEEDIVVEGLFIPKGTIVLFNLWAINRDSSLWENPHHFDPTRFLLEDGSLVREKPSYHVGFSFGKRSCPGEAFALMQIFLTITFILQRYNVELGDELSCDLDDPTIDLTVLKKMRLRFQRRFKDINTCNDVQE
ncbi:hypothetical protein MTO96_039890, partial [Rhipicephalus appendiculatus]